MKELDERNRGRCPPSFRQVSKLSAGVVAVPSVSRAAPPRQGARDARGLSVAGREPGDPGEAVSSACESSGQLNATSFPFRLLNRVFEPPLTRRTHEGAPHTPSLRSAPPRLTEIAAPASQPPQLRSGRGRRSPAVRPGSIRVPRPGPGCGRRGVRRGEEVGAGAGTGACAASSLAGAWGPSRVRNPSPRSLSSALGAGSPAQDPLTSLLPLAPSSLPAASPSGLQELPWDPREA